MTAVAGSARLQDAYRPDLVLGLEGPMAAFNAAGVLAAVDVHAALRIGRLAGCDDPWVLLAVAFAVRAPRFGHVFADLDRLADTVTADDGRVADLPEDAWPEDTEAWVAAVAASPLVAPQGVTAPLRMHHGHLYLDRYWRYEWHVANAIANRSKATVTRVGLGQEGLAELDRLFPGDAKQRQAAQAALTTPFAVIAGGPGTGKTSTIARLVTVAQQHARRPDGRPVRIAIAAPTGKAAARLGEAMRQADTPAEAVTPKTLHRLLGWAHSGTRFRHNRDNPLPYDLVIVDEVSMVSLGMLANLLQAVAPDASLVLVGDPDQLAAVEAGTALGDIIVGAAGTTMESQVVTLDVGYRSVDAIDELAVAIRQGEADEAVRLLTTPPADGSEPTVSLVTPEDPNGWPHGLGALAGVREALESSGRQAHAQARIGNADAALAATLQTKVLCAHRRGPQGIAVWNAAIEGWIHEAPAYRRPEWYAGRPIIVTENDRNLEVYNGDIGVAIRDDDGSLRVVIDGRKGRGIEHRRLANVQTVHAMTVHKSQGSQFDHVIVVLPFDPSPVLTRELLYTAVTRARTKVTIVGTEDAFRGAIERRVSRASNLPERLKNRLSAVT